MLDAAEEVMAEGLALGHGRPVRVLAGRIFSLEDGVWTEAGSAQGRPTVRIKAYSAAYFSIAGRLKELGPVLREWDEVVLAGRDVRIHFGPEGREDLTEGELADLISSFRG